MRQLILLTLSATILVSCSTLSTLGSKLNDDAVSTAAFALCYGSSVGAIRRQFTAYERSILWDILKCPDKVEINTP